MTFLTGYPKVEGDAVTLFTPRRTMLQISLRSYGEDELALRVPDMEDAQMKRIQEIAWQHYKSLGLSRSRKGSSDRLTRAIMKADCLAVVKVLEGAERPLKRKRRKALSSVCQIQG